MKAKLEIDESERSQLVEKQRRALCDLVVMRAVEAMVEFGSPIEMIVDRILTYGAAQACQIDSPGKVARAFRTMADEIEDGLFHSPIGRRN